MTIDINYFNVVSQITCVNTVKCFNANTGLRNSQAQLVVYSDCDPQEYVREINLLSVYIITDT